MGLLAPGAVGLKFWRPYADQPPAVIDVVAGIAVSWVEIEGTEADLVAYIGAASGAGSAAATGTAIISGVGVAYGGPTIWDAGHTSPIIVLSDGGLTATNPSLINSAQATRTLSGKVYFEIYVPSIPTSTTTDVGVGPVLTNFTSEFVSAGIGGLGSQITQNAWNIVNSGAVGAGGSLSSGSTPHIHQIAFDHPNRKFYYGIDGTWLVGNPAAGSGGVTPTNAGTFYPELSFIFAGTSATANFGRTAFTYPVPAGYGLIDGGAAGESIVAGTNVGTATGIGAAVATGAAIVADAVSATGTSTAQATGQAIRYQAVTAAGVGAATATSQAVTGIAVTAAGTSTATTATGAYTAFRAVTAAGIGTAAAFGGQVGVNLGYAPGLGAAVATGSSTAAGRMVAAATSTATATGQAVAFNAAVANATGTSTAQATGRAFVAGIANAVGTGTAAAVSRTTFASVGTAAGLGSAQAGGQWIIAAVAFATGIGQATAVGLVSTGNIKTQYLTGKRSRQPSVTGTKLPPEIIAQRKAPATWIAKQ